MPTPNPLRIHFSIANILLGIMLLSLLLAVGVSSYRGKQARQDYHRKLAELTRDYEIRLSAEANQHQQQLAKLKQHLLEMRLLANMPDLDDPQRVTSAGFFSNGSEQFRIHCPTERKLVVCYALVSAPDERPTEPLHRVRIAPVNSLPAFPQVHQIQVKVDILNEFTLFGGRSKDGRVRVQIEGDIEGGNHLGLTPIPNFKTVPGAIYEGEIQCHLSLPVGPDTPTLLMTQGLGSRAKPYWLLIWVEDELPNSKSPQDALGF